MALKVDYYTSLSRAVAGLDRDSYAARGAVYDREHKALLRRLFTADPPHSDAEIEQEQQSFRDAVQRIEFGGEDGQIPLVAQRDEFEEAPAMASVAERRAARSWSLGRSAPPPPKPARDEWPRRRPAQQPQDANIESALEAALNASREAAGGGAVEDEAPAPAEPRSRKSITGRVFRSALLGVVVIGIGIVAYDVLSGDVDLPWLRKVAGAGGATSPGQPVGTTPTGTQEVFLFDGNRPDPNGPKFPGTATWRVRSERVASQREPSAVVQLDLEVPGRKVAMTMTMRREPPGSAMSHLLEFRFLREDKQQPDPDIANIASVVMTTAELARPTLLAGQVVNVTPGVFLFGLSGNPEDIEKNLRNMKELGWLGIPLAYSNGANGVLVVEKGADGDRAINEAIRFWAK
jgi:hypothetical protein